jgi:hypothetical protein
MVVSGALMQRYSPFQVVAAFHGLAILLCIGFLLFLVTNGAFRKRGVGTRQTPENVYD